MKIRRPLPVPLKRLEKSSLPGSSSHSHSASVLTPASHAGGHGAPHGTGHGSGKTSVPKIMIQLEGFSVSASTRTYNFRVIDAPGESRQFWVHIPLEWFGTTPLKFQDCPLITLERLKQELDREVQESHAADANLNVGKQDIQDYLERHYPPKARTWPRVAPAPMKD